MRCAQDALFYNQSNVVSDLAGFIQNAWRECAEDVKEMGREEALEYWMGFSDRPLYSGELEKAALLDFLAGKYPDAEP